jgi:hypothetical protein
MLCRLSLPDEPVATLDRRSQGSISGCAMIQADQAPNAAGGAAYDVQSIVLLNQVRQQLDDLFCFFQQPRILL